MKYSSTRDVRLPGAQGATSSAPLLREADDKAAIFCTGPADLSGAVSWCRAERYRLWRSHRCRCQRTSVRGGAINVCNEKAEQRTCHSNFPFTTQTGTTCCASNLRPAVWRSSSVDQARVGKKLSDGHSFVSDICSQHVRTAYVVPLLPPTYHARAVPTPDRQRPSRAQGRWRDAVRTCHEVPRAPRRLSLSYSHFWRAQQCAQSF